MSGCNQLKALMQRGKGLKGSEEGLLLHQLFSSLPEIHTFLILAIVGSPNCKVHYWALLACTLGIQHPEVKIIF